MAHDHARKVVPQQRSLDIEVGERIRTHRLWRGLSQVDLGKALGITFQQIQKYERGTNRVSASRLVQIAKVFGVPPANFFPEQASETGRDREDMIGELAGFLKSNDGRDLNTAFAQITAPAIRKAIVGLVLAIAEQAGTNNDHCGACAGAFTLIVQS